MRAEIEKALSEITQGEWETNRNYVQVGITDGIVCQVYGRDYQSDAHFIANAPKWMRFLLSEIHSCDEAVKDSRDCKREYIKLKAERDRLREALKVVCASCEREGFTISDIDALKEMGCKDALDALQEGG